MNALICSIITLDTTEMPRVDHLNSPPPEQLPATPVNCIKRLLHLPSISYNTHPSLQQGRKSPPQPSRPPRTSQSTDSGEGRMQPLSRGSGLPGASSGAHPASYLCAHLQTKARRSLPTPLTLASRAAPGLGEGAAPVPGTRPGCGHQPPRSGRSHQLLCVPSVSS